MTAAAVILLLGAGTAHSTVTLEPLGLTAQPPSGVAAIAMSGDGAHVYAVDGQTGLWVYSRDAGTGQLTFVETLLDGTGGVNGLWGGIDVAVSSDGAHVYVAALFDNAVAAFERDPGTGALTFVEAEIDGIGGIDGLNGASAVLVSADGAHVYVTGKHDQALVLFDRDGVTGALSHVETEFGTGDALDGSDGMAFGPGDAHLYVAGRVPGGDGWVAGYTRNPSTGEVALANQLAPFGMSSARDIAVSPDGGHVYTTGNPPWRFSRDLGTGELTDDGSQFLSSPAWGITFAGNARDVVVAGSGFPDAVSTYLRDPVTGALTFVEKEDGGIAVVGPSVLVSPDGAHVYVSADDLPVFGTFSGCGPSPAVGCRSGGAGKLVMLDHPLDTKDSVIWAWSKGTSTTAQEFDGTDQNDYVACIYTGPTSDLSWQGMAPAAGACGDPAKPCWKVKSKGSVYKDKAVTPEGIKTLKLTSSDKDTAKIKLSARGDAVAPPALPLALPVRVQLLARDGNCWESLFTTALKNDAERFKAKE